MLRGAPKRRNKAKAISRHDQRSAIAIRNSSCGLLYPLLIPSWWGEKDKPHEEILTRSGTAGQCRDHSAVLHVVAHHKH